MFGSMMVNTPRDLLAFAGVFVCGVCVGVVFDIFRAHRKVHPPSSAALAFQDALLCAIAFFLFSHTVSIYADGDLRWYIFAGFILGVVLYFLTISRFVFFSLEKAFSLFKRILSAISKLFAKFFGLVSKPFLKISKKVKSFFCFLGDKTNAVFNKNNTQKFDKGKFYKKFFEKIFTSQKK